MYEVLLLLHIVEDVATLAAMAAFAVAGVLYAVQRVRAIDAEARPVPVPA